MAEGKKLDKNKISIVIEQERQREAEKAKIRRQLPGCLEQIEDLLCTEAYGELLQYFQTEHVKKLASIENDLAVFLIIMSIYQMELEEGTDQGILHGIHSMTQAQERYLKAKFLMWRLEFLDEKDDLAVFLEEHLVSVPFLKYLIHTSSFAKAETAFKLAMICKEQGKFAKAFAMLGYVNQLSPGAEAVFCEMADICIQLGQMETAAGCIRNIKESSGLLTEYQRKWGMLS